MPTPSINAIITTACHAEDHDSELVAKSYAISPKDLNRKHFKQMVLERGYELAEETFVSLIGHDDYLYAEDKERGYTELYELFHINEQILAWCDNSGMKFHHFYGDTHECWKKPEEESSQ